MDMATAIKISLRAFGWGIVGFLPVIGLVPAFYVLSCWGRVKLDFAKAWNPASPYFMGGVVLSSLGIINSICVVFGIIASIMLG